MLWVTFKDVKKPTWDACFALTRELLGELYSQHRYLLDDELLTADEAAIFREILAQRAALPHCELALRNLCRFLRRHHRQPVVILIDEYDTPIHAAFSAGYYDQAIDFFRTLLGAALKDNEELFKGVLTGILRIAKESIFSGLNNLRVVAFGGLCGLSAAGEVDARVADLADDEQAADELPGSARPYCWHWGSRWLLWVAEHCLNSPLRVPHSASAMRRDVTPRRGVTSIPGSQRHLECQWDLRGSPKGQPVV